MNYKLLEKVPLFMGCDEAKIKRLLEKLPYKICKYSREEYIFRTGETTKYLGVVLEGTVRVENIDIMGNRSILGLFEKGEVFAESYACIPGQALLVDVLAAEAAEVLFINVEDLLLPQTNVPGTEIVVKNLLRIASRKNQRLSMRIFHSTPKTIRGRLYSYFSEQVTLQNSYEITIPLDRQQLADYLSVDRTALSKELGKMREEGLITYKKNHFEILVTDELG